MSDERPATLGPDELGRFLSLTQEAVESVAARFYEIFPV